MNERQQKLQRILETAADGFFEFDETGCVRIMNRSAETLIGLPASHLLGEGVVCEFVCVFFFWAQWLHLICPARTFPPLFTQLKHVLHAKSLNELRLEVQEFLTGHQLQHKTIEREVMFFVSCSLRVSFLPVC